MKIEMGKIYWKVDYTTNTFETLKSTLESFGLIALQQKPLGYEFGFKRVTDWKTPCGISFSTIWYVSFSGGKDSTVLLHLVRSLFPDVPAVFSNTGLEYPELQKFVKTFDNVITLYPDMNFKEVITKYGYPLIGKEVAEAIYYARRITHGGDLHAV